jgi:hypothetical protein
MSTIVVEARALSSEAVDDIDATKIAGHHETD